LEAKLGARKLLSPFLFTGYEVKNKEIMKMFENIHLHIIPYMNVPSSEDTKKLLQNYSCGPYPNKLMFASVSTDKEC
jgi:hypothetical protein